jgi:hypothetical protein
VLHHRAAAVIPRVALAAVTPRVALAAVIPRAGQAAVIPHAAPMAAISPAIRAVLMLQWEPDLLSPVRTFVQARLTRFPSRLPILAFSAVAVPLDTVAGMETMTGGTIGGAYFLASCRSSYFHQPHASGYLSTACTA